MNLKRIKSRIVRTYLWLLAYLTCVVVLVVEASLNGAISGNHSNGVGEGIGNIVNDIGGDQSKIIEPNEVIIETQPQTVKVGSHLSLKTKVLPEDATYKGIVFSSSNPDLASVNGDGLITFKQKGEVEIKAISERKENLSDSIQFIIENVYPTSISSSIENAEYSDGIYTLEAQKQYQITTNFEPFNVTNKSLEYSLKNSTDSLYLSVSKNDGKITTKNKKSENAIEIIISTLDETKVQASIFVKTEEIIIPDIPLTGFNVNFKNTTMSINESINLFSKISFTPSNATNKKFTIVSSDNSIIKVNGTSIKALKNSDSAVTLTIIPEDNKDLKKEFLINVKVIQLTGFKINVLGGTALQVNKTGYRLNLSSFSPNNASAHLNKSAYNYTYSSSNPEIVQIDQAGNIKALRQSNGSKISLTVTITSKDGVDTPVSSSIEVTTFEPTQVDDFTFNILKFERNDNDTKSETIYLGKEYNLNNYITFARFLYENNEITDYTGLSTTLTYEVDNTLISTLSGSILKANDIGVFTLNIKCTPITGQTLTKGITFYVVKNITNIDIDKTDLNKSDDNIFTTKEINVNDSLTYKVFDQISIDDSIEQQYSITKTGSDNISFAQITSNTFTIFAKEQGEIEIKIVPILDIEQETIYFEHMSQTLKIIAKDILITNIADFDILIEKEGNKLEGELCICDNSVEHVHYDAIRTDILSISTTFRNNFRPTKYNFSYESLDTSIAKISQNKIMFLKPGVVSLNVSDNVSKISKIIKFDITNIIKVDSNNPYTLICTSATKNNAPIKITKDDKGNIITEIIKGYSYKLKINFDKESTYKNVKYFSGSNKILTIGQDGSISPIEEGATKITYQIDDGFSTGIKHELNIKINRKNLLDMTGDFFMLIRKGLGHFGAFTILSICSTMFFLLQFSFKDQLYFIPLNFAQGFGIASLTELIQIFVPGRAGLFKDVLIDFSGFALGASIVTLVYLIIKLIKYIKNNRKKRGDQQ